MNESHQSYAKDFEASTEDVDLIVERSNTSGAEGARLTGGGFGGEGTVTKFAESLGPVRTTNFGKHFDVVSYKFALVLMCAIYVQYLKIYIIEACYP